MAVRARQGLVTNSKGRTAEAEFNSGKSHTQTSGFITTAAQVASMNANGQQPQMTTENQLANGDIDRSDIDYERDIYYGTTKYIDNVDAVFRGREADQQAAAEIKNSQAEERRRRDQAATKNNNAAGGGAPEGGPDGSAA